MLQALAVEGSSACGAAEQKTLTHHITAAPNHVPDALHSEHGIENIKRNHRQAMNRIGTTRSHKGSHGSYLANSLLQNLTVAGLAVRQQTVCIHRAILLPVMRINARNFE